MFSGPAEGGGDNETQARLPQHVRSRMYWEFRKALDPAKSKEPVALPPGDRIITQHTAARWQPRSGKIVIESKEDIRARLAPRPTGSGCDRNGVARAAQRVSRCGAAKPAARVLEDSGRCRIVWGG